MRPSALYRSGSWRAGLALARMLPGPALEAAARNLALAYWAGNRKRREIVESNLAPALGGDRAAARRKCRELFRQFGLKLADLWRYEAGADLPQAGMTEEQWLRFEALRNRGRGVLLLTPHLGNWELGAPLLRKRGVSLQVITQAEPQAELTRLREEARARQGIETLVIGENPFAFVEVIRRLEAGAVVALLVDRPPPASAVSVRLFGKPFAASIAPAELARASGCALLPASIVRRKKGCEARILPELGYDRKALGTREARASFAQQMMNSFEPAIREDLDQWFHFVPLWERPVEEQKA